MKSSNRLPETVPELLNLYINRLKETKYLESKIKLVRLEANNLKKEADKLEDNLKAIQNN